MKGYDRCVVAPTCTDISELFGLQLIDPVLYFSVSYNSIGCSTAVESGWLLLCSIARLLPLCVVIAVCFVSSFNSAYFTCFVSLKLWSCSISLRSNRGLFADIFNCDSSVVWIIRIGALLFFVSLQLHLDLRGIFSYCFYIWRCIYPSIGIRMKEEDSCWPRPLSECTVQTHFSKESNHMLLSNR